MAEQQLPISTLFAQGENLVGAPSSTEVGASLPQKPTTTKHLLKAARRTVRDRPGSCLNVKFSPLSPHAPSAALTPLQSRTRLQTYTPSPLPIVPPPHNESPGELATKFATLRSVTRPT